MAICDLAIGTVYGSQDTWTDWCQVDPLAIGTHSVEACADVLNEVQEAFEDNNCRTEDLEIAIPDAYYIPEGLSFNAGDTNVEIPIRLRYSQEFYRYELRATYDPSIFSFRVTASLAPELRVCTPRTHHNDGRFGSVSTIDGTALECRPATG